MCRLRTLLLPFACCVLVSGPGRGEPLPTCPPATTSALSLPNSRATVALGAELVIVTIGSSSTQGWAASDGAHTYPALLQDELQHRLATTHVAIINRGVGGQDAAEEWSRLARDVIAVRPNLVIWQVGANGALRRADPDDFRRTLVDGIAALKGAGADVVLMDNQRSPAIMRSPVHASLEHTLAAVAAETGVGLFSRGAVMDQWQQQGYPYGLFVAPDGLHHNDLGYRCIALALARTIAAALSPAADVTSAHR